MILRRYLEVIEGPDRGARMELFRQETLIGRAQDAHLRLNDDLVSWSHCKVVLRGEDVYLEDQHSTNGCKVNGQAASQARLKTGDTIQMGSTVLRLISSDSDLNPSAQPASQPRRGPGGAGRSRPSLPGLGGALGPVLLAVLVALATVPIMAWPLITELSDTARQESLGRYGALAVALAAANAEYMGRGQTMFLSTSLVDNTPGVLAAQIMDREGRVLVPVNGAQLARDDGLVRAILRSEGLLVRPAGPGQYDVAAPLRQLDTKSGRHAQVGAVFLKVSTLESERVATRAWGLALVSLALLAVLAVGAALFIMRLAMRPVAALRDACEAMLKGDATRLEAPRGPKELALLAATIQRLLDKGRPAKAEATEMFTAQPAEPLGAQRQLAALSTVSSDYLIILDGEHRVAMANQASQRWLNQSESQLRGRHLLDLLPDQALLKAAAQLIDRALKEGHAAAMEVETAVGAWRVTVAVEAKDRLTPEWIALGIVKGPPPRGLDA